MKEVLLHIRTRTATADCGLQDWGLIPGRSNISSPALGAPLLPIQWLLWLTLFSKNFELIILHRNLEVLPAVLLCLNAGYENNFFLFRRKERAFR